MQWLRRLWQKKSRNPRNTADSGARAEALAEQHLCRQGLKSVARNFRCRDGELDLIMRHGDTLVFVEVRYRRNARDYDGALGSINHAKQQRILRCARFYLAAHPRAARRVCRFDIVAIDGEEPAQIQWLQGAFQEG